MEERTIINRSVTPVQVKTLNWKGNPVADVSVWIRVTEAGLISLHGSIDFSLLHGDLTYLFDLNTGEGKIFPIHRYVGNWTPEKWARLLQIWRDYGKRWYGAMICEHMRDNSDHFVMINVNETDDPEFYKRYADREGRVHAIEVTAKDHPQGLRDKRCPVCNWTFYDEYRLAHYHEPLPQEIVAELKSLIEEAEDAVEL